MKVMFEIDDAEVRRVLAPLLARDVEPAPAPIAPDLPAMMRVGEAAAYMSLSRNLVYRLMSTGQIPSIRIGRTVRIPTASLRSFLTTEALRQKDDRQPDPYPPRQPVAPQARRRRLADAPPPAPPRIQRVKKEKTPIDLSPRPTSPDPLGWTREDQLRMLEDMEKSGWPAELTALVLSDWEAGLWRPYVLRAADLAELLKISKSTAGLMLKRGQIASFTPEPVYKNEKPVTFVSVLEYERFIESRKKG